MTVTDAPTAYDAVVVGARAAGAATAMLLARQDLDVLLVDRADPATDTLSTHALMRGAVVQLDRWGLLDRLVAAGTPPIERVTFHYGDEVEEVDLSRRAGALYAPRRTVLDPLLVDAARAAGVSVRLGLRVEELLRDRRSRVEGVVATDRRGGRHALRARMVIGADGLRSTVARLAAAPIVRTRRSSTGVVYRYTDVLDPSRGYGWRYQPGAAAGLIPTNDGLTCVWAGVPAPRFDAERRVGLERWFADTLRSAAPDVADAVLADDRNPRLRGWSGRPGFLRRAWGPGVVLVGDAGGFTDPISAHGISDAFRDAELAARAVTAVLYGEAAEEDALADFQARRDALAVPVLDAADAVAAVSDDPVRARDRLLVLSDAIKAETAVLRGLSPDPVAA